MIVQQFLDWMEHAPVVRRADAISALVRSWLHDDLEGDVRTQAEAAFTIILDDSSPIVRQSLADALAHSPKAPRHIILALAVDQAEIAATVLRASPVFVDAELVDLVATLQQSAQVAIAERRKVSSCVAAAIAEVGSRDAILALCANKGAEIANFSLKRIIERFGDKAPVRECLLARSKLPVDLRQMLIARLSDSLSAWAIDRAWMRPERAELVTREARDRATVNLANDVDAKGLWALVEHLRGSGQLTTALILRAICAGNLSFFEVALSCLSGLPLDRVGALIESRRAASFRAVYAKAGLPEPAFAAFFAAVEAQLDLDGEMSGRGRAALANRLIETVLERYRDGNDDAMDQLMVMLRRLAADSAREAAREYIDNERRIRAA